MRLLNPYTHMKTHLLLLITLLGALLCGCSDKGESRQSVYYSQIKSVDKLALAQLSLSKMATLDDLKFEEAKGLKQKIAAIGDAMKIGDRKAAYSYTTYMRAYIDLSTLNPSDVYVDDERKRIVLSLPEIQTEYQGRDPGFKEEHYRVTGLRSQVNADERARIKEHMNTMLLAEVEENPIYRNQLIEEARDNATAYFQSLAGAEGYEVVVNFKN